MKMWGRRPGQLAQPTFDVDDGAVGFIGGAGVADLWRGNADAPAHWRDSHFRLEGPAVGQMQAAFMDNWLKTEGTVLHGEDYFPALNPQVDVNIDHPECWNKDGKWRSLKLWMVHPEHARKYM